MRELNSTWDDRLFDYGIDAVLWQLGDDYAQVRTRKLTIIFKEMVNDKRVTIDTQLVRDATQSRYSAFEIPQELEQRGIEDLWATTTTEPNRSVIYIKMKSLPEPITIKKNY